MTDYVRKEELKEFFEGITISVAGRTKAEAISVVLQAIYSGAMKLPTTDAEPVRHGRWIGYPECLRYKSDIECSVCGEVFNILSNETKRFDYCPNCGAKMEAEEKGNEE